VLAPVSICHNPWVGYEEGYVSRLLGWRWLERPLVPADDSPPRQVVGRELNPNFVPQQGADMILPHLARRVDQHLVTVLQPRPEHGIGQSLNRPLI